jgi:hypothetical protein
VGLAELHARLAEELATFAEEREFLLSFGWDDRRIAQHLGMEWPSYRRRFLRHPELGPIRDPEEDERRRWAEMLAAIHANERRRGRRRR